MLHTVGGTSNFAHQQGKPKHQDNLLKQALIGSHLAPSPTGSPAYQWTATPDAALVESGKISPQVSLTKPVHARDGGLAWTPFFEITMTSLRSSLIQWMQCHLSRVFFKMLPIVQHRLYACTLFYLSILSEVTSNLALPPHLRLSFSV